MFQFSDRETSDEMEIWKEAALRTKHYQDSLD